MNSIKLIIITGPGASGKTMLCSEIVKQHSHNFQTVSLDNYWYDFSNTTREQRNILNLDDPKAYNMTLLEHDLKKLIDNQSFKPPVFDFETSKVTQSDQLITPDKTLLLEGTLVGAIPCCRELASALIYIDTPLDICLCRRIIRRRSTQYDSVIPTIEKYLNYIRPGYVKYVNELKNHADIKLTGTDLKNDTDCFLKFWKTLV